MSEVQPHRSELGLAGVGLVAALIGTLAATDGLGPRGWAVGLTCGVLGNLWLVTAMARSGRRAARTG